MCVFVYGRRALAQYQVAALLVCRQKTVQTAVQSACRRFEHVVLYSPTSVFGRIKHLLVGLRIAQHHLNALCRNLLYRSAVHHLGAGVGHVALSVWIDYYDVALAEVGRVGSLFHVKLQLQTLHHTVGRESELLNRHFLIYIACRPLVLKSVEPDGCKSTVVLGLVAHLGKQMFAFHEF